MESAGFTLDESTRLQRASPRLWRRLHHPVGVQPGSARADLVAIAGAPSSFMTDVIAANAGVATGLAL